MPDTGARRRTLDADCHQMESPGLWQEWIDERFRERAPRLEKVGSRQTITVEGEPLTAEEGKYPFATPDFLAALARGMQRFEHARKAGFSAQGAARGHGPRGRRRADPVSDRRRPAPRPRVSRPRAAGGVLPRLQPLERRVLPGGAGAPALGGDAPAPGRRSRGRGSAPRRRGRRGGLLPAPEPGAAAAACTTRICFRCGPRSSASAVRSASTIRARRVCRPSASGWTRTPPATSSRIPSKRWPRWRA